jgi:hypothetical protein
MRTLLSADIFRTGDRSQMLVRQPAETVVAACKALGVSADNDKVAAQTTRMGQRLLVPPNVGGWPTGGNWFSPATALARYEWALLCQQLWAAQAAATRTALPPSGDLDRWAAQLGLASLSAPTQAGVRRFLASGKATAEADKQASVLVLLLASPDWMVM